MKKFISGFVTAILIIALTTTAFASNGSKSITAAYRNIKVAVNNTVVALKDAKGNTVEPFIYNGTTYLPVRAVSEALGQEVSWDANTNTVYIGEQPSAEKSSSTPANTVIYNENGLKVTYLGCKTAKYTDGYEMEFKYENTGNKDLAIVWDDELINNVEATLFGGCDVQSGKIAYTTVTFSNDTLSGTYHVNNLESISFKLDYWEDGNYSDPSTYSQMITIVR